MLLGAAALYHFQRQSIVFLRHTASAQYAPYALGANPGALFEDFYVVRDGATDCSFVAALMLMLHRDPSYGSRIVRETPDGYSVRFPALPRPVSVTREDLRQHQDNWDRTRDMYSRIWRGNIPLGLEVLRTAYYNYQAASGIRGRKGEVHDGGSPAQDLVILSGTRTSRALVARCPGSSHYEGSFASCPAQLLEARLTDNGRIFSTIEIGAPQSGNPLERLGNLDRRLVIVTTRANTASWWGPRLVPYHTYYYLGTTPDGSYVLGNPYQTRRPIVVTPAVFMREFLAVDYVDLG